MGASGHVAMCTRATAHTPWLRMGAALGLGHMGHTRRPATEVNREYKIYAIVNT